MYVAFLAGLLLCLSNVSRLVDGCSSRNAGGRARPPNALGADSANQTFPCPEDFSGENPCMNGGTCFTYEENSTDFSCKCADGFCGATCEDKRIRNGGCRSSSTFVASGEFEGPDDTYPCPEGPAEWLCLNGGTCFTVFENGSDYACFCPEDYCGLRCGEKYTRYGCFSTYLVISASVASAGCVAVCLVMLLLGLYTYFERKRSLRQKRLRPRNFNRTLSLTKEFDCKTESFDGCDREKAQKGPPSISCI